MDGPVAEATATILREASEPAQARMAEPDSQPCVAYVMSRFPKLSETFVLYEILSVEQRGIGVEVYPLLREREPVVQPEAAALAARAHYEPFLSLRILASQAHWLVRAPRAYLGALWASLAGTLRSPNLFAGAVGIFPKVAHAARDMERRGVSHVHCHFATHPALAGFIVHRLTGIPFSFTAHGSDLHVDRTMLRPKVAEASFVAAISRYNRNLILEECGPAYADKVDVIHCGVDTSVFHPAGPRQPGGPFRILCVGTLHEVKGQEYLVDACALLAAEGVDFVCRLVGDGPSRRALEERIRARELTDRVVLAGALPRDRVARMLHEADVLVAPSVPTDAGKREGIPVVLMEALGSGVPAVASDLSGIPELVIDGQTGLLVPPRDATALAAALARLASDPALRDRLGARGREKVLAEFDLRQTADALVRRFLAEQAA